MKKKIELKNGEVFRLNGIDFLELNDVGDAHILLNKNTPLRKDAFDISDEEKIERIANSFSDILETLGMDLNDESISGTPVRFAKMYVKELFKGLKPTNKPEITLFKNEYGYCKMLLEKNISVKSYCEHHFVPITGKAHIAYIPKKHVIGLSKLNRIVDYFARRPQVQERLTEQIAEELKDALHTKDVAVLIEATHMCVSSRGIQDDHSSTVTSHYSGKFLDASTRNEFLTYLNK